MARAISRLVSSLLYGTRGIPVLVLNLPAFENQKYTAYDCVMEMVHMEKFSPRKNQSEHSDLPQDYVPCYTTKVYIIFLVP